MTAPRPGDRVRATCGESVIVGVVEHARQKYVSVTPDGAKTYNTLLRRSEWTFEVLGPLLPVWVDDPQVLAVLNVDDNFCSVKAVRDFPEWGPFTPLVGPPPQDIIDLAGEIAEAWSPDHRSKPAMLAAWVLGLPR